jgi:predicted nucleotidyltransferase
MLEIFNRLKPFFEDITTDFGVREFARKTNISPPTASTILTNFEKKRLLTSKAERGFKLYKANTYSEYFRDLLKLYNIWKIRNSKLIEQLNKYYLHPTIILFGSFAKGENIPESDIDICIISEKTTKITLQYFEKKLNHPIQIFVVKELSDLKNKHLIKNIMNGTILQGEL